MRPMLRLDITISHTFTDGSGRSIQIEPPAVLGNPVEAMIISDIEWKDGPAATKIILLRTKHSAK